MKTTREDLVRSTFRAAGRTKPQTIKSVAGFLDVISDLLVEGHNIQIRGFGTFYTKERKGRPARNPRTGAPHTIPNRRVVLFRFPGKIKKEIGK